MKDSVDKDSVDAKVTEVKEIPASTYEEVKLDDSPGFFRKNYKYIIVFVFGVLLTIFVVSCLGGFSSKSVSSNVSDSGIGQGISNIYDATVYIENYKDKKVHVTGTGFVYKKDSGKAYILTNYHVVANNSSLKVVLSDDKSLDATFVGGDEYLDIAVISVSSSSVKQVAKIGSSTKAILGDTVFTVGSPVGDEYRGTVTRGILSGKDRLVTVSVSGGADDYVMRLLQTDAAMNPGNSGGPLCNASGEVIGMNSLKLVKNEVEGMGFAIPIEDIMSHVKAFEKDKSLKRPYLGISMINLSNTAAVKHYNLDKVINTKLEKGVVVESVEKRSSSDGKLERGDIVIKLDNKSTDDMAYFRYELFKHEVGDKITLTVERKGKLKDVVITLREK